MSRAYVDPSTASLLTLVPVGCDRCGSTSLQPYSAGTWQCRHCRTFLRERVMPPVAPAPRGGDRSRPPPSAIHRVSATAAFRLDPQGALEPPPIDEVLDLLDANGPAGFFRPSPLSKGVTVVSARRFAPVKLTYIVFCERRRYEEVVRPLGGRTPDPSPLPPLWDAPLKPARSVTTRRVPVAGQERAGACPACASSGTVACAPCGGDGRTSCARCGGAGRVTEPVAPGSLETSRAPCAACDAAGWARCAPCNGAGRTPCGTCAAGGRVLHAHERVEEFAAPTALQAITDGRDWSQQPWMPYADGQMAFDHVAPGLVELDDAVGPVGSLAAHVVAAHNAALGPCFVYWSRLTVMRVPVIEVAYRVRDTPGVFHVYGLSNQVAMPGRKPFGCLGFFLWAVPLAGLACAASAWT